MTKHRIRLHAKLAPWLLLTALIAVGPLLAGCAAAGASATPTPTKTPRPPTEMPTNTPEPTATMPAPTEPPATEPPAETDTPAPTETAAAPTAEATAPAAAKPTAKPAARPAPGGGMASPDFGAQAFLWWRPEIADRDLQLMQDAGFTWVKQLFSWQDIEGAGNDQYDWSSADRVVDQAAAHGLKLIVRLSQDPDRPFWAGNAPENADHFANFAKAVATRYKGRIAAYQVWNEPNLGREWGNKRPDPAGYAELLRKTYGAIKSADPNATVITAGMAPTGTDNDIAMPDIKFYEQMYQAMGGNSDGYFDMLGAHAAGFAAPPEISPDEAAANKAQYGGERFFTFRRVEDIRRVMEANGDADKRIAVLEFGWSTDKRPESPYYWHGAGAGIDEATRGKYLVRAFEWAKQNWQPWIGLMTVIYMPDAEWTKEDEQYWWSILGPGYPDLYLRPGYVELCIYFNGLDGEKCKYDPNAQ
jgi:polysaccharide biosynthesis protein PslG